MNTEVESAKKASKGLLIAGYIFAVLGGLIGLFIGVQLLSKIEVIKGKPKQNRYDSKSRKQGIAILIISITSMIIGKLVSASL